MQNLDILYRKKYTANHRSRGVRLQIILPKTLITRLDIRVETGQLFLSVKDSIGTLCIEILQTMLVNVPGVLEEKARHKELLCSLSLLHNQWK